MILGLQELEFILDSVTRLGDRELEAGLTGLVGGLKSAREITDHTEG